MKKSPSWSSLHPAKIQKKYKNANKKIEKNAFYLPFIFPTIALQTVFYPFYLIYNNVYAYNYTTLTIRKS